MATSARRCTSSARPESQGLVVSIFAVETCQNRRISSALCLVQGRRFSSALRTPETSRVFQAACGQAAHARRIRTTGAKMAVALLSFLFRAPYVALMAAHSRRCRNRRQQQIAVLRVTLINSPNSSCTIRTARSTLRLSKTKSNADRHLGQVVQIR